MRRIGPITRAGYNPRRLPGISLFWTGTFRGKASYPYRKLARENPRITGFYITNVEVARPMKD
jgi:hypothetical protein